MSPSEPIEEASDDDSSGLRGLPSPSSPTQTAGSSPTTPAVLPDLTDTELRDALVALTAWDAMPWPHATGLGQLMMWVSAYARGLLPVEKRSEFGRHDATTH